MRGRTSAKRPRHDGLNVLVGLPTAGGIHRLGLTGPFDNLDGVWRTDDPHDPDGFAADTVFAFDCSTIPASGSGIFARHSLYRSNAIVIADVSRELHGQPIGMQHRQYGRGKHALRLKAL